MSVETIHGACPHDCPDTCGVISEVEDGRAVRFYADPNHPVTRGWLCVKVRPYLERVYHPNRLTHPLRRVGPKGGGQWARITWDEAVGEIAARWQAIMAESGAAAILPYSYSGTLGLVQMAVCNARLWNRLGASQLQRAICGAAAEFAVETTLGARHSPAYDDVQQSRLVILWGHNPASTAPHFMAALRRAQRAGAETIVIDPRRTRSAHGADLHLAPRPGTDGCLALGLAHVIVQENRHDEAWLQANTVGWPQFKARLADYPPARAAQVTGLAESAIVDLARRYASVRPGLIKIADGLNRHRNGGQTVRAICALPAITGQIGAAGAGLAYSTSGYLRWDSDAVSHVAECPPAPRSVNMNRLGAALLGEVSDPPIRALYVYGANPAASAPNAGAIAAGLQRPDLFTVVHELFMTDTAAYADIVLPATSQLEHTDLHKAYGHTFLQYNRPAIAPLGESKSNWDVMRLLAQALGFDDPWLRQDADAVIEEVLTATANRLPALHGVTLARLQEGRSLPLTLAPATPFADLNFPTPSGKVELFSQSLADLGLDPLPGYVNDDDTAPAPDGYAAADALQLISGASHHFVSSSLANLNSLLALEKAPFLEIHPLDAAARQIGQGDRVIVENRRGYCTLAAVVTAAVRPGVVVSPKGRWPLQGDGRNINWTTSDALGDMAGQSTFHCNRVWVRPANGQPPTPGQHPGAKDQHA